MPLCPERERGGRCRRLSGPRHNPSKVALSPTGRKGPSPLCQRSCPDDGMCPRTRSDKGLGAPPGFQGRSAGGGATAHLSQPEGRSASSSTDTRTGGNGGSEEAAVGAATRVAHAGSGLHDSTSLRLGLQLRLDSGSVPAPAASVRRPGGGEKRGKRQRTPLGTERPGARRRTITWCAMRRLLGNVVLQSLGVPPPS